MKTIRIFHLKVFHFFFLVVKFSIYLKKACFRNDININVLQIGFRKKNKKKNKKKKNKDLYESVSLSLSVVAPSVVLLFVLLCSGYCVMSY